MREQAAWAWRTLTPLSAARYLWWKLRFRLGERLSVFRFTDPSTLVSLRLKSRLGGGKLWIPFTPVSLYTLHQVWVSELYAGQLPSDARTIIDLGANIGLTSRWLLSKYPDSRVVAVEPETTNLAVLKRNLKDVRSATVVEGCIASKDGEVFLALASQADSHHVTDHPGASTLRVPAVSMPTLIARCGLDEIDLIKIDIEGAEADLLKDSAAWIRRVKCLVIELHERELPFEELERRMASYGFRVDRSPRFAQDRIAICTNVRNAAA